MKQFEDIELDKLQKCYPNMDIFSPERVEDIPASGYMVYVLSFNNKAIVLGHGRKNRAKVIFDDENHITSSHFKALLVRLYRLSDNNNENYERYIIKCTSKEEAVGIEKRLHKKYGGNNKNTPIEIKNQLFNNLDQNSVAYLVLEIALRSSFDGLSDIKKWRADDILRDDVWTEILQRLRFPK